MFKKMMALAIVFMLSTTSFAQSVSSHSALKPAFDTLEYKLSVEWDQNDVEFKKKVLADFEKTISELAEQGLKASDLLDYVKANVLDENLKKDLDNLFKLVDVKKMSVEEAKNVVKNYVSKHYAGGASWSGRGSNIGIAIAAVALTAVILVAVLTADYVVYDPYYDDPYYDPYYDDCYWGWDYDYYGDYVYDCWYY